MNDITLNEVLIRVHAEGVNPADTYIRSGTYYRLPPNLPYTPGFDACGVIERIGADVTKFKVLNRGKKCSCRKDQQFSITLRLVIVYSQRKLPLVHMLNIVQLYLTSCIIYQTIFRSSKAQFWVYLTLLLIVHFSSSEDLSKLLGTL